MSRRKEIIKIRAEINDVETKTTTTTTKEKQNKTKQKTKDKLSQNVIFHGFPLGSDKD